MRKLRSRTNKEAGFVLVYMAAGLTTLLLFSGLAVDSGRAYLVKAQLTKAVDGAALAAARNLNSGDPRAEASKVFKANFPSGYLGTRPRSHDGRRFLQLERRTPRPASTPCTSRPATTLPTTFMNLGATSSMLIGSEGEATRRMVDLSLVLDVSSSIGWRWPAVRDAARTFVSSFDATNDRISLITFGNGATVLDAMPSSRGFNKTKMMNDIPDNASRRQHEHGRRPLPGLG